MTTSEKTQNDDHPLARLQVSIGTDIVTVLLTATLLVLPIEDGRFWPAAFVAFVPLLLRLWKRSYLSIYVLSFFSFFLYIFYVLQWVDSYGFHWRLTLVFMNAIIYAAGFLMAFYILRRYKSHFFATVFPTVLILIDFEQTLGFLGFPWPLLCHSQWLNLPLIQIASITGCWGVTFLILHVNEALAHLIAGGFKTKILPIAVLPVILIGASGLYGAISLARGLPETNIEVTVVQWDEATNVEWTETFTRRAIDGYTELVLDELVTDPQTPLTDEFRDVQRLIIWPETSVPDAVLNLNTMARIQGLSESLDATFLVGCMTWDPARNIEFEPESLFQPRERRVRYNSVVAFEPDRSVTPVYSKIHPVGFGEVIPMKNLITNWFPDYPWGDEDVVQGDGFFIADTEVGKIGSVICYESFFPQIARTLVRDGAEILELGSNTSWFGKTPASYQHARFDVFRAVENRIWFCRSATTGVSSVIDPQGQTVAETRMFEADAMTASIGLREVTTLYTRWGDWLPALCGIWFMFLILGAFVIRED